MVPAVGDFDIVFWTSYQFNDSNTGEVIIKDLSDNKIY